MNQPTICFSKGVIKLIDQTKLPLKKEYIYCRDVKTLWQAIKRLSVRGAPALGVAAAFGILLGIKKFRGKTAKELKVFVNKLSDYIGSSRPTAVNLFNALEDMKAVVKNNQDQSVTAIRKMLEQKAFEIYETDRKVCRAMGDCGAKLIKPGQNVMTICNAGALATVDYGTALGVFYSAKAMKKKFKVYACETRPLLQGARLTSWELSQAKIDVTLICDSMAASLMKQKKVDMIFTGADRIAANGDSANKIGTYNLAVLARYHKVPFYIVAPFTTFDLSTKSGKDIPIEQRDPQEVLGFSKCRTAPRNVKVYNPAFDVTDHKLIKGIITEHGIIKPPYRTNIKKFFKAYACL